MSAASVSASAAPRRGQGSSSSLEGGGGGPNGAGASAAEAASAGRGFSEYERIMGRAVPEPLGGGGESAAGGDGGPMSLSPPSAEGALSSRLAAFRRWLSAEAGAAVHPSVCVVNGEATDGTKNAPVLVFDRPSDSDGHHDHHVHDHHDHGSGSASASAAGAGAPGGGASSGGRVGAVDWVGDQRLYDRTMGCQVRSVREIKPNEVIVTLPRGAFVTPDLVASSDAGRAVLACCEAADGESGAGFWDAFENTTICESGHGQRVARNTGPQLLVKILQERKRAEAALARRVREGAEVAGTAAGLPFRLVPRGTLSTRAPLLAFLIHQRFANAARPPVASGSAEASEQFRRAAEASSSSSSPGGSALRAASSRVIARPPASPDTFAPYARTLPSFVSIPLCWRRSELALLASSLPGTAPLQDAAARTLHLASEFVSLLEAGVLERFPATFPPGVLTWERWVWAAAVAGSRALPAAAYVDAGTDAFSFAPADPLEFQSPPHVWDELGVLVPLLDMLNHESDAHQVTWEPNRAARPESSGTDGNDQKPAAEGHRPRAVTHKKVKKGSELYCCYGDRSNSYLLQQYGFAQLSNASDEVKLGWGLADAVGHLDPPGDYAPLIPDEAFKRFLVYETPDGEEARKWWTDERLALLEREAFAKSDDGILESLKSGKKMTSIAYADGTFYPILLTALIVATMPKIELQKFTATKKDNLVLSKRHQQVFRSYLAFFFSRKLEKLLQNVSSGLKDHFQTGKLWTGYSKGGIRYTPDEDDAEGFVGWQSFFDSHVYKATMEVEGHYYAMGAESCVLALYDGNLRALQTSLDAVVDDETYASQVVRQIEELGFELAVDKDDGTASGDGASPTSDKKSPKNRKRARSKTGSNSTDGNGPDKQAAVKLHVGNLSFETTPDDMYEYFSNLYGKDSILECHIPKDRATNRSRGFGFVTMPEPVASRVLSSPSSQKHEMAGRPIKLARSNSAGATPMGHSGGWSDSAGSSAAVKGRCPTCGYRENGPFCKCRKSRNGGDDDVKARDRAGASPRDRPREASRPEDDREHGRYGDRADRDRDERDRRRDSRRYDDYPHHHHHHYHPPPHHHYPEYGTSYEYHHRGEDRYGRSGYGDRDDDDRYDRHRDGGRGRRDDDDAGRRGGYADGPRLASSSRRDRRRSRSRTRSRSRSRDRGRGGSKKRSKKRSRSSSPAMGR